MTSSSQPFILGVNYWPRRKAMYWWSDFDSAEVQDEFSLVHDIGMSMVRVFLLWDDWQPLPTAVSRDALQNLGVVAGIAADLGLQLDVTFFTGHMSGPNWAPGWLLQPDRPLPPRVRQLVSNGRIVDCGYANMYTDATALRAEQLLLRTVVSAYKDHPGIGIWNLGNEPDLFAWPPDPAAGRDWVRRMTALIHDIDSAHPVSCGLHTASLIEDNHLRIPDVYAETDLAVIHGYPMYAEGWSTGPLDPDFVPYLCALVTALCGKPTLAEEFGGCTAGPGEPSSVWSWTSYGRPRTQFMAAEEDLAAYLEQVLPRLVEVGALGAMLWCFADYIPELWQRPPCDEAQHERFFGLVRPDGSLKPHAEVIRRFAATQPIVQPPYRTVSLTVRPEDYYQSPLAHAIQHYRAFLDQGYQPR